VASICRALFYGFKVPERADRWNDDAEFADKVLHGSNPVTFKRVNAVPETLNVTDDMVARQLGVAGLSLRTSTPYPLANTV
jgi:hypothetical protein